MRRRHTVLPCLAIAALTALALAAPPGSPAATADETDIDPVAGYLIATHQIDRAEAQRRLELQDRVDTLIEDLDVELGDLYGGVWLDDGGSVAKAGVLPGQEATVGDLAAGHGVDAVLVPVTRSLAELRVLQENLLATLPADSGLEVGGLYTPTNQVTVRVVQPAPGQPGFADQAQLVARLTRDHAGQIRFHEVAGRMVDAACVRGGEPNPNTWCDAPIRGGVGISAGDGRCSAGFNVRSRSDGVRYLLTSGHCGRGDLLWETRNADSTVRPVGHEHRAINDARGDAMIIRLSSQHQSAQRPWVFVTGGSGTTRDESYLIHRIGATSIGMSVCMTGRRDGTQCGTVTDNDVVGTRGQHVADD
jgi:hypothetical protein